MNYDEAVDLIRRSSFATHQDALIDRLLPTVRIETARVSSDDLTLGESRFGGEPDVPSDFVWPLAPDGTPLSFLAQIDLAAISAIHADELLPRAGWLFFFYNNTSDCWGIDVKDFGQWRVILVEHERDRLQRFAPLTNEVMRRRTVWSASTLQFEKLYVLPSSRSLEHDIHGPFISRHADDAVTSGKVPLDSSAYDRALFALIRPSYRVRPEHRLLGYPCEVQGAMTNDFHGLIEARPQRESINPFTGEKMIFRGRPAPECSAEMKELLGGSEDWRLLLQIDSEKAIPDWMWGDLGMLYFWIPRQRLEQRDFDSTWMFLQCS